MSARHSGTDKGEAGPSPSCARLLPACVAHSPCSSCPCPLLNPLAAPFKDKRIYFLWCLSAWRQRRRSARCVRCFISGTVCLACLLIRPLTLSPSPLLPRLPPVERARLPAARGTSRGCLISDKQQKVLPTRCPPPSSHSHPLFGSSHFASQDAFALIPVS